MGIDDAYARLARELTDKLRADETIGEDVRLVFTAAGTTDPPSNDDEMLTGDEFMKRFYTGELMSVDPWWMGR